MLLLHAFDDAFSKHEGGREVDPKRVLKLLDRDIPNIRYPLAITRVRDENINRSPMLLSYLFTKLHTRLWIG
jgi:hypothetical protein